MWYGKFQYIVLLYSAVPDQGEAKHCGSESVEEQSCSLNDIQESRGVEFTFPVPILNPLLFLNKVIPQDNLSCELSND